MLRSSGELNLYRFTLVVNGPGTYSESNLHLNCKSIYICAYSKNSGDHILEGKADELSLRLEGLAWVDAKLLEEYVKLAQRSLKSSYVHATDHMKYACILKEMSTIKEIRLLILRLCSPTGTLILARLFGYRIRGWRL